jgi:hypothetical protein
MKEEKKTDWLRWAALIIASCGLLFQILVLYPWHEYLSREFAKLAMAVKRS